MVARWRGAFAKVAGVSASARARTAHDLAGRRAPLAAVGPGLLRTGRGDRTSRGFRSHCEAIALRCGRRDQRGLCFAGRGGGLRLSLRISSERGHHGSADGERERASCKLKDRHLTTHPAAPVAPRTRSGVLGVSRRGETKGSRSKARFPAHFPVKTRHPARPGAQSAVGGRQNGPEPGAAGAGYDLEPLNSAVLRGCHGQM